MPYINEAKRGDIIKKGFLGVYAPGELNFSISWLLMEYWQRSDKDYQAINDILGALEGAKLEFYRRVAVPYEETKIKENGDIY